MLIVLIILILISVCFNAYLLFKNKKPKKIEITEEEKQRREKINKAFNNLMEYDYDVAVKTGDK